MSDQLSVEAPREMVDFDPFGLELRTRPFSMFPTLIEQSPGFMLAEGTPSAFVASHADVTAVARDFKRFSSVKPAGLPGMERFDMFNGQPVMNYCDPPDHTRRRKVVNASFTPKRVERLHEEAQKAIGRLLDGIAGKPQVEVLSEVCQPLSTQVLLGAMMDVDPEDWHLFFATMKGMGMLDQVRPGEGKPQPYLDAWAAGSEYCRRAIDQARAEGRENLVTLIADASEAEGKIDDDEMMAMMMVLLTGGLSTVASAAATALLGIAGQPELKDRIRQDPSLALTALEEAMRLYPPVTLSMRFAMSDAEIGGKTIPAGMPVYVLWAAANHDPAVFPDPYRFDIDRPNLKDQVAFGFGIHTCIGNAIPRSIIPMLVCAFIERFPDFALADPDSPPKFDSGTARGRHLAELQLKLSG